MNLIIFGLYAVVRNFAVKRAHYLIRFFSDVSSFSIACVCNHCHWTSQNRRSMMGLTSHISCVYDAFSSYCVSFFFNDESDDDGSGSGSYGTCSYSFSSENSVGLVSGLFSVGRVSGIFSVNRITKSVGRVSGIFSVCRVGGIFSFSRVSGIFPVSRVRGIFSVSRVAELFSRSKHS